MTRFEKHRFSGFDDRDSRSVFDGFSFHRCEFDDCLLSITSQPELRSTIRNCELVRCTVHQNSTIGTAIVEDSLIDGLTIHGLLFINGAAFKHVTICGRIGRLDLGGTSFLEDERRAQFAEANAKFYESVDWALDLTRCEASELRVSSVPGHLILRDTATQILVTRQRVLESDWTAIDFGTTAYDVMIEHMLKQGRASEVLIAPRRSKAFSQYLEVQQRLRDAGIAEPD